MSLSEIKGELSKAGDLSHPPPIHTCKQTSSVDLLLPDASHDVDDVRNGVDDVPYDVGRALTTW